MKVGAGRAQHPVAADHVAVGDRGADQQVEGDADASGRFLDEDLHLGAIALAPRARIQAKEAFHAGRQRR